MSAPSDESGTYGALRGMVATERLGLLRCLILGLVAGPTPRTPSCRNNDFKGTTLKCPDGNTFGYIVQERLNGRGSINTSAPDV